jgi:hypothetical protein
VALRFGVWGAQPFVPAATFQRALNSGRRTNARASSAAGSRAPTRSRRRGSRVSGPATAHAARAQTAIEDAPGLLHVSLA